MHTIQKALSVKSCNMCLVVQVKLIYPKYTVKVEFSIFPIILFHRSIHISCHLTIPLYLVLFLCRLRLILRFLRSFLRSSLKPRISAVIFQINDILLSCADIYFLSSFKIHACCRKILCRIVFAVDPFYRSRDLVSFRQFLISSGCIVIIDVSIIHDLWLLYYSALHTGRGLRTICF